jgi:hypothetical protein
LGYPMPWRSNYAIAVVLFLEHLFPSKLPWSSVALFCCSLLHLSTVTALGCKRAPHTGNEVEGAQWQETQDMGHFPAVQFLSLASFSVLQILICTLPSSKSSG